LPNDWSELRYKNKESSNPKIFIKSSINNVMKKKKIILLKHLNKKSLEMRES
jgi:hypothetical protein